MKKILLGLTLLGGVGCMNVQPVGPLAGVLGSDPLTPVETGPDQVPPDPVTVQAERPVPPAVLITPAEVAADDPTAAARKLLDEFEYDRQTMTTAPRTAEVSVYKNGVKQE